MTLGLIADLYEPDTQHWPLCFIVLSSTIGTSIGGVIGGPIERCELIVLACEHIVLELLANIRRSILAVKLLDPAHLRSGRASRAFLHAREPFDDPIRSGGKATAQDWGRSEQVWVKRA